jgi:hypothetical protein
MLVFTYFIQREFEIIISVDRESMLKFLRFSPIFSEKMAIFFKNQRYDPNFAKADSTLNKGWLGW